MTTTAIPEISRPAPGPITRSTDHIYTFEGKQYQGVTSILKLLGATFQQASYYGAKQAATVAADLLERPGTIEAMFEAQGRLAFIKGMADTGTKARDQAASLGTEVHDLADQLIRGVLDPASVPDRAKGHVKHYLDWWTASGWTVRASEAFLVHPDAGYGGTLDLLCRDRDGRTVLADIKTGKAVYQEAVLQLTAYGIARYIQPPGMATFLMPPVDRYAILHVTADGVREIEVPVGKLEHIAWLACLDLALWRDTMKGKRL